MRKTCLPALLGALMLVLAGCSGIPDGDRLASGFRAYRIFSSHMVIQRDRPVFISGRAELGKYVKVEFAGRTVYARAGVPSGEWEAGFPAMPAGGPYSVRISGASGAAPEVFDDVMVGEVWLCSGQSNMEMPLWNNNRFWRAANAEEELKKAANPGIRFYNASSRRSTSPFMRKAEPDGPGWQVCAPPAVGNFSALAYFFGREIQKELGVTVGLIGNAWGGSRIEAWISEEALESNGCGDLIEERRAALSQTDQAEDKFLESQRQGLEKLAEWRRKFYAADPEAVERGKAFKEPGFDDSGWGAAAIPGGFGSDIHGVGWYRCTFDLPADFAGRDLVLRLGPIDDCDETFFNGEPVGGLSDSTSPETPWDIPRVYNVPGKLVKSGRNVIAVRVTDYSGDSGLTSDSTDALTLTDKDDAGKIFTLRSGWKFAMEFRIDPEKLGARPSPPTRRSYESPGLPSTLFNGMQAPWFKYPVCGILWYQGESNAGRESYYKLLKMMIADWRKSYGKYGSAKMPFLIVQLAGFEKHTPNARLSEDYWMSKEPVDSPPYALTREIQAAVVANGENLGLASAIDAGDHSDIHPRDKQSIGKRLAAEAMHLAYGRDSLSRGPVFRKFTVEPGGRVRVHFDNVGKGLTTADGKAPGAFALAGADGKLHWAEAVIDGDTVVVSSPAVAEPKVVRYAYCQYRGDINLMNRDGFPAEPFRSDAPDYEKTQQRIE